MCIRDSFTTDGINSIGTNEIFQRQIPTTYTATIGTVEDFSDPINGVFVVPNGFELSPGETSPKSASLSISQKLNEIVFNIQKLNPNLDGVKTSDKENVILKPGDVIEYTITVTNSGPGVATDVLTEDYIPNSTEFISATDGIAPDSGGKLAWNAASIAANGGQKTYKFKVRVLDDPTSISGT